jgi:acyl carrier protein
LALQRVVLLRPGGLPKTSSGKVQRSKCRTQLETDALPVLYDWRARTLRSVPFVFDSQSLGQSGALERQLADWLRGELSVRDLTWQTPLTELGIDSLRAVELVDVLSAAFDHTFPVTSMFDHPTIASLARLIRTTKLGGQHCQPVRHNGYTPEQIAAFDERELTDVLALRVAEVLDGGER